MRKLIAAVVVALSTFAYVSAQEWLGIDSRVGGGVYRLESMAGNRDGVCSAALINSTKGYVLTAAHCVPDTDERVSLTVGKLHASVIKINDVLDLAVLEVKGLQGRPIYLRREPVEVGQPIAVIGFAFAAARPKYNFGYVSDPADPSLFDGMFLDAEVIPGQSGGVVVDPSGRLVGTTQAVLYRGVSKLGIAADAKAIALFAGEYFGVTPAAKK